MIWLSLILLGYLSYSDFKYRTIPFWGILVSIILSTSMMDLLKIEGYWISLLITLCATTLQFGLIWAWFHFIKKNNTFFDNLLGWGDIAAIALGIVHFSVTPFMLWLVIVSLTGLIWYWIQKMFWNNANKTIPLAGLMTAWLIPVQLIYYNNTSLYYLNPIFAL